MSSRSYHVVYLTGAPATGKSTLLAALERKIKPVIPFSFSKELAEHISRRCDTHYSQNDMRQRSSQVITPEDVAAVDSTLLQLIRNHRASSHIIIDSHPVTKESYGFRVTPFNLNLLAQIQPTILFVLYTEPQVVIQRIKKHSQGRPVPSTYEASLHNVLQASVALTYGIQLGVPVYLLDSNKPVEDLVLEIYRRIHY